MTRHSESRLPPLANETARVRVCVVVGVRLFREGLADIVDGRSGMEVVGAVPPGTRAPDEVGSQHPDVVLIDLSTAEGLAMLCPIAERLPDARLVAVSVPESEPEVLECARAGVAGYVSRDESAEDLLATLASVMRGELRCPPRIASILRRRIAALATHGAGAADARLTSREQEIVRLIAAKLSNREIAGRLSIEESTVKNHVHNILEKLRVRRRSDVPARVSGRGVAATPTSPRPEVDRPGPRG